MSGAPKSIGPGVFLACLVAENRESKRRARQHLTRIERAIHRRPFSLHRLPVVRAA